MICRVAILLLIALTSSALAEQPSSYGQEAPLYEPPVVEGSDTLLPAPIANGTARANDAIRVASHVGVEDLPPAPPEEPSPLQHPERALPQSTSETSPRHGRLLRRSSSTEPKIQESGREQREGESPVALLASDATTTALAATALVVGLFLVCAWALKKGMPKSSRVLPREAVEILGRCPLGNKQFAHLLHVGNKVILVSVTPNGAETLVEVDNPNEVTRILGVCASASPGSTSKEFDAMFHQFAKEPTPKGYLGDESPAYSTAASAYSELQQGGRRG
jgi:flagellar biogenesis protein FliO